MNQENMLFDKCYRQFKNSASCYLAQKKWIYYLEENHPWLVSSSLKDSSLQYDMSSHEIERQYELLLRQVDWVDRILLEIENKYGIMAREYVYEQFVLHEKQSTIAEKYGISVRTLQRRVHEWLFGVFTYESK